MKRHIRFYPDEQVITLLDQRYLPDREKWFVCRRLRDVIEAMQSMVVRGAPALGVVAAYACCLSAATLDSGDPEWQKELDQKLDRLAQARPTAVNLVNVVDKMRDIWKADADIKLDDLLWLWVRMAKDVHTEDISTNKAMGEYGMELMEDGDRVMTHCNAGALATGGYGTALGVFRASKSAGKELQVIANETRPFLQGARLTAYELLQDGISVSVSCDNAAGYLMSKGLVDKLVVGADRITLNGDTVNKIGTYTLALLASQPPPLVHSEKIFKATFKSFFPWMPFPPSFQIWPISRRSRISLRPRRTAGPWSLSCSRRCATALWLTSTGRTSTPSRRNSFNNG